MVPHELVIDLLDTQTLFCRYVGIGELLRCLMSGVADTEKKLQDFERVLEKLVER
jgi:hypothetical protein